jgi:Transposase
MAGRWRNLKARNMRVSLSTMRNKTDRNDARGIAQMMRLGWFRAVYPKNVEMQKMRKLLTNRKLLKRKLVEIENHIRGALRTYGLLVGAVSRGQYEARVRELIERTDIVFSTMIETLLDVRRAIFYGYAEPHRALLQVVQRDPICRRLMSVPGVGPVAALSLKVGVDDPCALSGRGPWCAFWADTQAPSVGEHRSTMKDGSPNKATPASVRRFARRPRAFCCASGNGPRYARGVFGSPNDQACCARSSRSRASLPAFCIACGSTAVILRSASAPRQRRG